MKKPIDIRTKITERQFQATVIEIAKWHGWLVFHPMPVQNTKGVWRTAVAGNIGFPDLVLAHSTRGLILAELKTGIGRVSADQQLWIDTLLLAGAETYVWRPKDLPEIQQRLKGRP
jgi:hypothetical protein